jgi:folylpolyglutamate synthase/dihydrofolate synthase
MQIKEALEKLFSLHTFGVKLGLENVRNFLELVGNPQNNLKTFHVAGSNGKGSTSSFIASILMEAGYKVGLYTSPHFVKFNERVKINNKQVEDEYIAEFFTKYSDYIFANSLTFFEVTTVLAFCYFSEKKTDYAIIETGLGGRLDATNVIIPLASVITSISLEHTKILGNTYSQIAGEKAGIIKPDVNTFIGKLPAEAKETIEKKCSELNSQLFDVRDFVKAENGNYTFSYAGVYIGNLTSPLRGEYQKYNAAIAILTVINRLNITDIGILRKGLLNVLKNTGLEGRFENYSVEPMVIFESAHNPEGIEVFLKEFEKDKNTFCKKTLLFGAMHDKSIEGMLEMLSKSFDQIIFTQINYERCAPVNDLLKIAERIKIKAGTELKPAEFVTKFIQSANRNECLVVLGSMYILGEIKTSLQKQSA